MIKFCAADMHRPFFYRPKFAAPDYFSSESLTPGISVTFSSYNRPGNSNSETGGIDPALSLPNLSDLCPFAVRFKFSIKRNFG
jgi:hypothetical protein